jgi:hypothetical protein
MLTTNKPHRVVGQRWRIKAIAWSRFMAGHPLEEGRRVD